MTLRNLMVPRSVNAPASEDLVLEADLSRALLEQDRSFVYRSFQAYTRRPAASGAAPSVESSP